MKTTLITHKANRDGSVTLYIGKGADRKELIDLEGAEIEIRKPVEGATVLSDRYAALMEIEEHLSQAVEAVHSMAMVEKGAPTPDTEGDDQV